MSSEITNPSCTSEVNPEVDIKQCESNASVVDDDPSKIGKEAPVFKVPLLIGPRPKPSKPKISQAIDTAGHGTSQAANKSTEEHVGNSEEGCHSSTADSGVKLCCLPTLPTTPENETLVVGPKLSSDAPKDTVDLPYKEPQWSGVPSRNYSFEVIKGGVIVQKIDLSSRSFVVCGRLTSSDIKLEHPSISRYHAIIQYRAVADSNHPAGFYLYDLDSTHGTQLNKCSIRPRCYYHLRVGHMIKFGGSTRMFILQGPEEDAEDESDLSVTEIKERRRQEEERQAKIKEEAEAKREKEDEDEGIDWGMGDDACEEDSYGENPYAQDLPLLNEDLYINDPKKTLRGWFEREGYDLEYNIEEKGPGHFLCRVELPLDTASGEPLRAEASLKGKKKEAVVACALEACRILDRYGVLRQAHHEGRQRKAKNWEQDDFYDSDEDTYLDQTGTIEKKRIQRRQRAGKDDNKVETYESLMDKHNDILKEIEKVEVSLRASNKKDVKEIQGDLDSLDAYMVSIKNSTENLDKKAKTRLKFQLSQMKQEEQRLRKLLNIAKPASLPPLYPNLQLAKNVTEEHKVKLQTPSSEHETFINILNPAIPTNEQDLPSESVEKEKVASDANDDNTITMIESGIKELTNLVKPLQEEKGDKNIIAENTSPVIPNCESAAAKRKEVPDHKKAKKFKQKMKYDYNSSDPNYAMWLPPEDQSGDGRTSLNDKYGY